MEIKNMTYFRESDIPTEIHQAKWVTGREGKESANSNCTNRRTASPGIRKSSRETGGKRMVYLASGYVAIIQPRFFIVK